MCRWCSLLACLCAAAACADEPTPEVPWFAVDFAQPWHDGDGNWSVASGEGVSCEWADARLSFMMYTNAPVSFTPFSGADHDCTTVEATLTPVDESVTRKMPAVPQDGARGALSVVERADHVLVYLGLTAHGWIELAGATPEVGVPALCRLSYDATTSPPRVSYSVDGVELVSAADPSETSFETYAAPESPHVEFRGAGEVSSLSGTRELEERQAAVVRKDGSFDYHADLAAACGAATNGAEVVLLRPVPEMDWSATSNGVPLHLAGRLAKSRGPIFTLTDEVPPGAWLALDMPPGKEVDCVLFRPCDRTAQRAVHVHGDPAIVYTLVPDDADGIRLRSGALPLERPFLFLGTTGSLYLQGGDVTLCGTNTYSGATVVESGTLEMCGVLTRSAVQVWERGGYAGAAATGGVFSVEGRACVDAPLTGGNVALADGAVVSFELETAENGMILVPRAALPVGGSVSVSVAVEGRFVATTRTALSGDVVAAVAGAPELAARRDAFAVAADGVTAVIANAVAGFWYSWEAADEPTGPFTPVGDPVRASLDGELEMSLAEPIRSRRFYRLRVGASP